MPRIAVVDPALGRSGAHNFAFASLLVEQDDRPRDLGIWCSTALSPELREALGLDGKMVHPVFEPDFFAIFGKPGGLAVHWDWIYGLARNYLLAFESISDHWLSGPIHLVHHSLSWEHASALALAIHQSKGRFGRLLHHAFLMYPPGMDGTGAVYDAGRRLDFRLAFGDLERQPGVRLYASCSEYAAAYAQLLGHDNHLPIHPCFLADWRSPRAIRARSPIRRIVLYIGEIKREKGFYALPDLLRKLLERATVQHSFLIQFVEIRSRAAKAVVEELTTIAAADPRVTVHHGFWRDMDLQEALQSADMLCLNYDSSAYAHKTSGLLWLAAWYGLTVWVRRGTWLEREAGRLGVRAIFGSGQVEIDERPRTSGITEGGYWNSLFTPLWPWLERECNSLAQGNPIGASAAALPGTGTASGSFSTPAGEGVQTRESGADIVLFWKQNDSCLYGRHHDMVARYLASRPDVRRVIVVDAPVGEPNLARLLKQPADLAQGHLIHDLVRKKERGACDEGKLRFRVFVCPTHKFRFRDDGSGRPHFLSGYEALLRDVFESEDIDPSHAVFWIYPKNFHAPHLIKAFRPTRVVVDVIDDQRAWPHVDASLRQQLTENYRVLLEAADMAFANCAPMRDAMRPYCPGIRLVPNGCDTNAPRMLSSDNPLFDRLLQHSGKVIGYVGNLEAKLDIPLLHETARRFPECLLVLVGSTHANPPILELRQYQNVLMPGVVPYGQLGAWMRRFDVGVIPHLETDMTLHMNPLKLYVYLSQHVPVVATRTPNIEAPSGLVRIADTHAEFLDAVAATLDQPPPEEEMFQAFVSANSWEQRLSRHVDELLAFLPVDSMAAR